MNLKATQRNVLVSIDLENKERYKFKSGVEIFIAKGFEYNLRLERPSIGVIIDGEGLPKGSIALLHHNCSHETYKISNVRGDNGQIIENLYSTPHDMIFCFKTSENEEWIPNKDFLITLRLFKPYTGIILGIEPEQVTQRLFIKKGNVEGTEIENKVAFVTKFSDYEIIFLEDNIEKSVIRTRSREILGVDEESTAKVLSGEYLVGNNLKDAKKLN